MEKCDPLAAHHSGDLQKPSTSQKARAPTSSSSSTTSSLSTMPSRPSTYHIAPSSANIKSKEKEKNKNVTFEEALEGHDKIMEQRQDSLRDTVISSGVVRNTASGETSVAAQHVQGRLAPTLCASSEGPTYASTNTQDKDIVYELIEDEAVQYTEGLLQEDDGQDGQRGTGAIGVPSVELLAKLSGTRQISWSRTDSGKSSRVAALKNVARVVCSTAKDGGNMDLLYLSTWTCTTKLAPLSSGTGMQRTLVGVLDCLRSSMVRSTGLMTQR